MGTNGISELKLRSCIVERHDVDATANTQMNTRKWFDAYKDATDNTLMDTITKYVGHQYICYTFSDMDGQHMLTISKRTGIKQLFDTQIDILKYVKVWL
jgi:hypothetical protein